MRLCSRGRSSLPRNYRLHETIGLIILIQLVSAPSNELQAQSKDWPFPTRSPGGAFSLATPSPTQPPGLSPPPLGAPMRQLSWEKLSNKEVSRVGAEALAIKPQLWSHGETENFVIHYRNIGDAFQIGREIEFDLWYVAKSLGAAHEQYARKSHVYVFQDEKEWQEFVKQTHSSPWVHSFALRDDLFLNIHGTGQGFDSRTLAHETTHAVVARIYRNRRWPLWLSEGFAEYMGDASNAARRGVPPQVNPRALSSASMTVTVLIAATHYPEEQTEVGSLYDSSLKFVRYLFGKYPAELFPKFVDRLFEGVPAPTALADIYGDEFRDLTAFDRRFQTQIR